MCTISLWVLYLDGYLDFISGLSSFQTSVKKTMAPEQVKFIISIFSENWQLCLYTRFFNFYRQEILYQYYAYAFHGSAVSWRAIFYYIYSIPSKCPSCIIYHTCSLQQVGITFSEWLEKTLPKSTRIHALQMLRFSKDLVLKITRKRWREYYSSGISLYFCSFWCFCINPVNGRETITHISIYHICKCFWHGLIG